MLLPVPSAVPSQVLEYHFAIAPVPALPPTSVKVVLPPLHKVETPEILRGAVEGVFTATLTEAQVVVLQVPLYLTK